MKFFTKIKDRLLSWRRSEPVRTTVYPLIGLALAFFVGTGKLDTDTSSLIDLAVGLILGVGGTEAARARVTPTARVQDHVEAQVQVAVKEIDRAVTNAQAELETNGSAVSQAASNVLNQISDAVQKFGQGRHSKLEQVE